jgi:N-acylneuraminate cytidylyltransferase
LKTLFLIPARAGSKGLPGKNTKLLKGKPLFFYSVEFALQNKTENDEICISTNDDALIQLAEENNISIPFKRPEALASDTANSRDVILHALEFYDKKGITFDTVLLLQPTSPLRTQEDFKNIKAAYTNDCDMAVSVKVSKDNPYFTLFEENEAGHLQKSKKGNFTRRQDCPNVYAFNGSMYLINVTAIQKMDFSAFKAVKKVVMPDERSVDIDTQSDWMLTEFYLNSAQ